MPIDWQKLFRTYALPGAVGLVIVAGLIFFFVRQPEETLQAAAAPMASSTAPDLAVYDNLNLSAAAAIVVDERSGAILYEKNADAQLPLASLTKIMTVLVASQVLNNSSTVAITPQSMSQVDDEGDLGFIPNELWHFADLVRYTLVASSNQGADAIAGAAGALITPSAGTTDTNDVQTFVDAMNSEAKRLNLSQTYFVNPSGLDVSTAQSGGYGSAKDVATLFGTAISAAPDLFTATSQPTFSVESIEGDILTADNTDAALADIPGLFASKTGYTDLAGGNLAVAFDAGPNRPMIAVVLGSTEDGRFTDIDSLVNTTLKALSEAPAAGQVSSSGQ